ncbi:polysaccharide deacetylase family protein [Brassicibacter mesophilus]|jgi:peptidoglycan-N-acetylglucosamine deacetylase|uniref:polysaccharide deacetylase family protein n=1 Tax=Brassicibacter mesophilus TaxID=745119 RepID=UPI003D25F5A3
MTYKRARNFFMIIIIIFICIMLLIIYHKDEKTLLSTNSTFKYPVEVVQHGPRDKKVVALTFDDGPHPIYTTEILDILRQYKAKATFFILGRHAEFHPELILRESKEGHEIGVHSFNHINISKEKEETVREEFEKTQDIIYKITGKKSKVFRPPYGIQNDIVFKIADENNCSVILWTYYQDSRDWSNPGIDKIIDTVLSQIQNGDIVLFHDHNEAEESQTVEALKIILPELIEKGYRFVTISELLDME